MLEGDGFFMAKRLKRQGLKRWELALLLAVAAAGLVGARLGTEQDALADEMIRLHVVANSDSEADQALKLKVRDAVLTRCGIYLAGLDREEAMDVLAQSLPQLGKVAADTVAREGYAYPVRLSLRQESFPTRDYTDFSLPAGEYTALRIELGEAAGHNWWCVVFPPLCTGSVTQAAQQTSLTDGQVALITGETEGYVIKFRAIELWEDIKASLS